MMDLALICIAAFALWRTPSVQMMLLFFYFSISSIATVFLVSVGYFDTLGTQWFLIYSAWLALFVPLSGNRQIQFLYVAQQLLCLTIVLQWKTNYSFLYNYYEYFIAMMYLKQLGCAYGDHNPGITDKRNHRCLNLAHNGVGQ